MSTQQDIYAAGSENRPPMLNKENYVPWSSHLLRYAKRRPNGKLIYNSIINGPYVRRMIPELGDANRAVSVNETFHEQTDDELTVNVRLQPVLQIKGKLHNPVLKEKGSVRFSALYLKKKSNLLVFTSVDMIVVSKSSAVTTADASDKRQQQQNSTSSTSTLTTTITADGNFDLSSWQYPKDRPTIVSQGVIKRLRLGSNTLSWKPCQGGSSKLNLPDHRYKRRCCSLIPAESDSLPHAHTQTTKTYYKHQDSRIKKAQELKTKTSAYSDIKDNSSETKLQGRLLASFQEDAKYEHVGQDTRSQGGKDDQD
ncbi:hypothetical protein Tco_1449261 [Tanacetum coccineum]